MNIFVSNGRDLVAVTDVMLTAGTKHTPIGSKLYQIDDKTICSMASFYHGVGAQGEDTYSADIPQLIKSFTEEQEREFGPTPLVRLPFELKMKRLTSFLEYRLTVYLQAKISTPERLTIHDPNLLLEITIAGYDLDGSLQVAELALAPQVTPMGIEYVTVSRPVPLYHHDAKCQSAGSSNLLAADPFNEGRVVVIRRVNHDFFCSIAGITYPATNLLDAPELRSRNMGVEQLRRLAIDIEKKTELDQILHRTYLVGGEPQIAVLSNGHVIEAPSFPPMSRDTGTALAKSIVGQFDYTCPPNRAAFTRGNGLSWMALTTGAVIQCRLTDCAQNIDGFVFQGSEFINSTLLYSGEKPLIFDPKNIVTNSSLTLSGSVSLSDSDVHRLICDHQWSQVIQDGKQIHIDCTR